LDLNPGTGYNVFQRERGDGRREPILRKFDITIRKEASIILNSFMTEYIRSCHTYLGQKLWLQFFNGQTKRHILGFLGASVSGNRMLLVL
jgi:hypothetical protein